MPDAPESFATSGGENNHAGYGAHQQVVTVRGERAIALSVVLLLVAIIYIGWQATIAINLLNNFKSNQFQDLRAEVGKLEARVSQLERREEADLMADKLKEKDHAGR